MPQQDDALFAAIARNGPAGVEAAIGAGADLNARQGYNHTALSRAVAKDSARLAGLLLERGADQNARSESGETPLHHARLASREVFDRLIAAGADPNAADKLGQTPLHLAVSDPDSDSLERFERVVRLINAGADPNARTNRQETPLHRAALSLRDSAPTIRQLLDAGADPKARDELGNTALHCAAGKSSVDRACAVDHLLRAGTGLHARNLAGATPLHFAAAGDGDGQAKTMTRLLSEHPDLTIRNADGQTPLDVATSPTAKEILSRRWPATARQQQETTTVKEQPEKNTPKKPDRTEEYHRQFADRIIKQIEQGTAPWQKPWKPGERVLPSNVDTGRPYAGGNSLHLAAVAQARGYADVRWGTYRQIQALGGQVRKGEQGTRILSYQDHKRVAVTDERGQPVTDSEGKRPILSGAAPPKTWVFPSTRTGACTTPTRNWSTPVRMAAPAASTSRWPPDTAALPPSGPRRTSDSWYTPPDPPRPGCFAYWAPAGSMALFGGRPRGIRRLSNCTGRQCNRGKSARV